MPVTSDLSTLPVCDCIGRTVVTWTATFSSTSENAAEAIAAIYETGFDALSLRFGG